MQNAIAIKIQYNHAFFKTYNWHLHFRFYQSFILIKTEYQKQGFMKQCKLCFSKKSFTMLKGGNYYWLAIY